MCCLILGKGYRNKVGQTLCFGFSFPRHCGSALQRRLQEGLSFACSPWISYVHPARFHVSPRDHKYPWLSGKVLILMWGTHTWGPTSYLCRVQPSSISCNVDTSVFRSVAACASLFVKYCYTIPGGSTILLWHIQKLKLRKRMWRGQNLTIINSRAGFQSISFCLYDHSSVVLKLWSKAVEICL